MTDLEGKTIARVAEYGDLIIFTDGTGLRCGEYGPSEVTYAEVREHEHAQQGYREQERMRRLEKTLHPRDIQWMRAQERAMRERANAKERARREQWVKDNPGKPRPWVFNDVLKAEITDAIRDQLKDANRILFADRRSYPKKKRKRRPESDHPGPVYFGKEAVIPVKTVSGYVTVSQQMLDEAEGL